MACGAQALRLLGEAYAQNKLVSQAFSAKILETGLAAQRMNDQLAALKFRIVGLQRQIFALTAESYAGQGNVLHFEDGLDGTGLRELADAIARVFSGSDETGYGYCLASHDEDLRPLGKQMTAALSGKGGGKPDFQQGSVKAGKSEILAFFASVQ